MQISYEWFRLLLFENMRKYTIIAILLFTLQCFSESITYPILQIPNNTSDIAFTVSDLDNSTNMASEERLFYNINVYNENGQIGYYSSQYGPYVSFSFLGYAGDRWDYQWRETKQVAFYSIWNDYRLSAFVKQENTLLFVDLMNDEIIASFPLNTPSAYSSIPVSILVYSGRLTSTAIHRIVVISGGAVNIYNSLPDINNVRAVNMESNHSEQFEISGRKANSNSKGIVIEKESNKTKKVIK